MTIQQQIIQELNVKANINPKEEIRIRIDFLKEYLTKSGAEGFVLGISGGQDSTLAGKLAQLAINELNSEGHKVTFIPVRLPHGIQNDEDDAQLAIKFIDPIEHKTFNIQQSVEAFSDSYIESNEHHLSDFQKGNVKARLRMIAQYAIGGMNNLLVIGTDHAAEVVTGFFTKYGDGGADILPLSGLTKRQGRTLLIELGAPEQLYLKVPTADLLDNKPQQSDETELGITYDDIDDYLEGKEVTKDVSQKIENQYLKTKHKRNLPTTIYDNWWK